MFLFLNLGGGEVFVILLVVVMLFGSEQLPQLVRGFGRGIREINDAKNQIQNEIQKGAGLTENEINKQVSEIKNGVDQVQQTIKRQVDGFTKNIDEESKAGAATSNDKSN